MADNSLPSRIWVYSTAVPADPTDIVSTIPQIGINNPDAFSGTTDFGVDVSGNVLAGDGTPATTGAIISDEMCDVNGNNCFSPSLIGGPATPRNDCRLSSNVGLRGFWGANDPGDPRNGARARCQSSFLPSASNTCTTYAIGFSGGRILCAP